MNNQLKYVPVFRGLQEEFKVLKTFDFGQQMYPCLEIVKEVDHAVRQPKKESGKLLKPEKTFEQAYIPIISEIDAVKVFVDLPVHLKPIDGMNEDSLLFLRTVITIREKRTAYMLKLAPLKEAIIPVISSYAQISGERGTIKLQEEALRPTFNILAFRVFMETFGQDMEQIKKMIQPGDYLFMDWGTNELDIEEGDQEDIVEELNQLTCTVITHRNPVPEKITNVGLVNNAIVELINNSHIEKYSAFGGNCFSDYAGIKKSTLTGAPITSPGFIYYDAVQNNFYGFRYLYGSNKKGDVKPSLEEFETTIVPAVLNSAATTRMLSSPDNYLSRENKGYITLRNIERHSGPAGESGKSPAKFKKIGMEHYLHCMKIKIRNESSDGDKGLDSLMEIDVDG